MARAAGLLMLALIAPRHPVIAQVQRDSIETAGPERQASGKGKAGRIRQTSNWIVKVLFALFLPTSVAGMASAASLVVDGDGQLLGARDVNISGILYEVQFRDDTFANIFGDASGLDARSEAEARLFGQALIDQVFVDSESGLFDTDPESINGCENTNTCEVLIPFAVAGTLVENVVAVNRRAGAVLGPDEILENTFDTDVDGDQADVTTRVYAADFMPQAPAPTVPAIGPLGLLALATLALSAGALAIHSRRS